MPEAFIIAEDFIGDDNVCMVLGDNIIFGNNLDLILKDCQNNEGATVLTYPVKDAHRFGVVEFDTKDVVRHGLVQKIVEAYAKFVN